jgi:hypothetical protein
MSGFQTTQRGLPEVPAPARCRRRPGPTPRVGRGYFPLPLLLEPEAPAPAPAPLAPEPVLPPALPELPVPLALDEGLPEPVEPELVEPELVEPLLPEVELPGPLPDRQSFGSWPRLEYIVGSQRFGSVALTSFFFVPAWDDEVLSLLSYVEPVVEPLLEVLLFEPAVVPVAPEVDVWSVEP